MNEKVKEKIEGFAKTFDDAKSIVEESFEKSEGVIQSAIDSNKLAAETRTIVDASTEWMILVKNDAYEKGRQEGYASASEHVLPVLQQKKEMIKQLDSLLKKFLDAMGNELTVAIDALEMNRTRIHDKDKQIQDQKELLNTRAKAISSLREEVESLKRENEALQKKAEEKPKRGRPRKKKEEDPLD